MKGKRVIRVPKTVKFIEGVDVSDYKVVELTKDKFISANFEQYPEKYSHLLIHAIQFQNKIPSLASMERTEKRNLQKVLMRDSKIHIQSDPQRAPANRSAKRNLKRSFKRIKTSDVGAVAGRARQPSTNNTLPKQSTQEIKIRSPEWLALKSARQACVQQLKKLRENPVQKDFPIYFKKKHQSHKRRLKEKRQLIVANKAKLVQIFGNDILDKECRIGIKDIRAALGLEQPDRLSGVEVGEFMQMVAQNQEHSESSSS